MRCGYLPRANRRHYWRSIDLDCRLDRDGAEQGLHDDHASHPALITSLASYSTPIVTSVDFTNTVAAWPGSRSRSSAASRVIDEVTI